MIGKKGIELSVNFIVILIISIIVFVGGLAFTYKFFNMASSYKDSLDQETNNRIDDLLADGSKVAIPFAQKEIKIGHDEIFGLGILNTYRRTWTYYVDMGYNDSYNLSGGKILGADRDYIDSHWTMNITQTFNMSPNEMKKLPILIAVPGQMSKTQGVVRGTYIFDVCVYQADPSDANAKWLNMPQHCPPAPDNRQHLHDGYVHQIIVNVP